MLRSAKSHRVLLVAIVALPVHMLLGNVVPDTSSSTSASAMLRGGNSSRSEVIVAAAASPTQVDAPGCSVEDARAIRALGGGHADGTFPRRTAACASQSYGLFSGFRAEAYRSCLMADIGISESCASCFIDSAEYAIGNCKWACFWGSWCGAGCLDCVSARNNATATCAGVETPSATPC
eukprot:TRINITY_DN29566_c0_g1_i1.p1 TRINITY_DN29566_c0_g1~~TRINITY_DN29566_c0_g1_i1.p1  ORF type:complete len:179 (-),score=23.79 TRINITY_DN29566_c0_g1_i1:159-695(-)